MDKEGGGGGRRRRMATGRVSYAQATAASRAGVSSSGGGNEGLTSGRPQERIPTCTVVDTQARNSTNYADGDDGKGRKNTAYEAALSSARLSAFDARTGNVRCVPCGKAFGSYKSLAVHLLAKHGGSNTLEAKFFNVNVPPTAARSMNSGGGGGSAAAAGAGAGGGGGASGAGVRKTQRERLQESSLLDFDALMRKGKGTKSHGTPTTSAASLGAGSGSGHRLNAHVKPSVGNGTAKVKNFKGRLVETTTTTTIPSDEGGAGHATTTTTTTTIEVQKKKKRPSILKRLIVNERKSKEYQNAIALVRKLEAEKDAKADVVAWHDADVRLVEKMLEVALTRWSATPAPAIACERTSEHEKHVAEDIDVDSVLSGLDAHLASVGVEKRGQAGAGHAAVSAPNVDACGVELPLVTEDEVLCIDLRIARDVLREKKRDSARLYDVADGKLQEAERVRASLEEEYAKKQKENEEKREQCVPVEPVDEGNAHGDDKGDNIDDGDDDGRQELDMVALQHRPQSAEATSEMYTSSDAPTTTHAASDVDTVDDPCTRQATASDATVLSDANEACDDDESRRSEPISSCGTKLSADGTADTDADVPCTAREDDDSTRDPSGGLDSVQPVCPDASMGGEKMQAIFDALAPSYSRTASNQVHCLLCPSCCTSAMDYLRHITGAKHRKAIQRVALAIVSRDNVLESNVRCAPDVMRSRVQTTPAVSGRVRTNAVPGDGMRYTGKMGDYAPYVFQTISPLLNEKVTELIGLLVKWQRRVKGTKKAELPVPFWVLHTHTRTHIVSDTATIGTPHASSIYITICCVSVYVYVCMCVCATRSSKRLTASIYVVPFVVPVRMFSSALRAGAAQHQAKDAHCEWNERGGEIQ